MQRFIHLWRSSWRLVMALLATGCLAAARPARAEGAVVRAVLFYSPTCSHCHRVMEEVLPPLAEQYGEQLTILTIDITQPKGLKAYQEMVKALDIPNNRLGVPTLVVGSEIMVGSSEIPERFPGLIEQYLAQGGVDWPAIPGLEGFLDAAPTGTADATAASTAPAATPTGAVATATRAQIAAATPTVVWELPEPPAGPLEALQRDPLGNGLAVLVLLIMLAAAIRTFVDLRQPLNQPVPAQVPRAFLLMALAGLGVAAYLTYVEVSHTLAACGPVGKCNIVQQSEYARLFGIFPVGIVGLAGYLAILAAWAAAQYGRGDGQGLGRAALLVLTGFGTLFSLYLTYLEPFVIGATCMWCLASAILMTGLFVLSGWMFRGMSR